MRCVAAWEEKHNTCEVDVGILCADVYGSTSDLLCECAPASPAATASAAPGVPASAPPNHQAPGGDEMHSPGNADGGSTRKVLVWILISENCVLVLAVAVVYAVVRRRRQQARQNPLAKEAAMELQGIPEVSKEPHASMSGGDGGSQTAEYRTVY